MAVFKCKMCGGTLEINNKESVATCEYCGTQQTLPKLDDERKANLYDRANHFRRNNEFDKAMGIYEQILNEDNTDAEAYWSLVLCRYGIEYVEDPSSRKRVPTVNRAQFTSVFDDDNYKSALQYADNYQKGIYENEAKVINEIQKGILAISQKEEPFDVFICYKETDNNGRRTPDSVLANDLYHQLTQEGFKVFFSRITLEDKLGTAYEPYIFAALNSAKVMVALGTKPEYFNAVWVKNEWSRYLALIKNGANKILIPAYKDMDPYDLPEEFSHLQAQDMSKLGFMQDLIRGIKKIAQADTPKATVVKETVISGGNVNTAPLLKRVFMFLEDDEWASANEYCEKVLDIDPECAEAYLGKLMVELKVRTQDALKECENPFDERNNYQKALRFADEELRTFLKDIIKFINDRNEETEREEIYNRASNLMQLNQEGAYIEAAQWFEKIPGYSDADILAIECKEKAEIVRKDRIYNNACELLNVTYTCKGIVINVDVYVDAIKQLKTLNGWKDSEEKIVLCQNKIEEIKAKIEEERLERERQAELKRIEAEKLARRNKKIIVVSTPIVCAIIVFIIVLNTVIIPNGKYNDAITLMEAGKYIEAYETFAALDEYKDSVNKASSIYEKYTTEKIKSAKVGDYVFFGTYEQDNDEENGKENIEWLVLDIKDGKVLVISKYALVGTWYNSMFTDITWEDCTLRSWLNNVFIKLAFSTKEKSIISTVTVSEDKNPQYYSDPGNATQDQVFLLSITEANKYFSSNDARRCKATAYAHAKGAYVAHRKTRYCVWWLRSSGEDQTLAAAVSSDGVVHENFSFVDNSVNAVRPAMWIDISETK